MNNIPFARGKGFYIVMMVVTVLLLPGSMVFAKWTSVTPPDVSSDWALRSVHFTSPSDGWAVGHNYSDFNPVLLHYSNGTWTSVTPPDVSSSWDLRSVHFTSPSDEWAVGYNYSNPGGVLLHYSNGTWTSVTPPDVSSDWLLYEVHFTSPSDGWAVGYNYSNPGGVLLHYSNGTWTSVTPPDVSSDWYLASVHFTSPSNGWAVGGDDSNARGVLLHYSNGTWTSVTPPDVSSDWYLASVHFTSPSNGWAVGGDDSNARGVLLHYSNGTWTSVTPPDVSSDWALQSVHFTSPSDGWAVGYNYSNPGGVLLHYSNGTWTSVTPPDVGWDWALWSVHFTSPSDGWAVGRDELGNELHRGALLRYLAPPPAPIDITASDGSYMDKVQVTWTGSLGAESYQVYRARSNDPGTAKTLLGTTTETIFNDTTAVPMKKYFYWVKASNTIGTGKFSAYDKGYRSDGSPLVPTNVSASDGTYVDRVEVIWSASLRAESYQVYRARSNDPGTAKTLLGTTTETIFNDTTAVPMKKYFYWVKASNTIGTGKFSAYDKGYRSDGSPLVPTNVSASDGTYVDRVEVIWSASLRAESYQVYRARSNDPGTAKTLLGTTTETIFNDTTAVPMKKYFYWVKASNTIGTGKFSAYDKGYRSDGSPLVPTNVSASDGTYVDRVEVIWSASLRAESYQVYRARSNDPGTTKTLLGTTIETIFNDTTAVPMKKYFYWVKASNTVGTSKFSAYDKGYR